MKALVIGSMGNIGRPLCAHLRELGWEVTEADIKPGWRPGYHTADINRPQDLAAAFDQKPDVVFNLAGMVSRVTCEQAPALATETNIGGALNVARVCRQQNIRLVHFSTSEVYGPTLTELMDERNVCKPNNLYGLTNLIAESLIKYECVEYGLEAVTVRPFMVYGEHEEPGDHRSAMIRFATALAAGEPITVHKDAMRSWLHIDDAVKAFALCATCRPMITINVGHPDVRSMVELAAMIAHELGRGHGDAFAKVIDLPDRMTLVKRPALTRQSELLGFEPAVSLEEGVRRVCARLRDVELVA